MPDLMNETFVTESLKGNVETLKKLIAQGCSTKYQDANGNTSLYNAASGNHPEAMRLLIENGADVNNVNNDGNTPLHIACDKNNKEAIFSLLYHGADPLIKNKKEEKPAENNAELKIYISSILSEKKAFKSLKEEKRDKLKLIFAEVDKEARNMIDLNRSKEINLYTEKEISDEDALKDAQDFISSVAISNKATVNLDEWLFAFGKLAAVEPKTLNRFIDDFDQAIVSKGKFSIWKP